MVNKLYFRKIKIFTIISLCLFTFEKAYAQIGEWFSGTITSLSCGMNFGTLSLNNDNHFSLGVYANVFGLTANVDFITDSPCIGENQYGMGHKLDDPDYYEYLFGYEFPIFSNLHEKDNGIAIYITPLIGGVTEDYYYSDRYYGQAVKSHSSSRMSYGGLLSLRFGHEWGMRYNIKISSHGISGGFAFSFGPDFWFK